MRFEKARKVQKLSFLGVSWFIMWSFAIKLFIKFSHVSKISFQNLKRCKGFSWKSHALYDFFSPNLCFPKRQRKSKNRRFLGVAWFITWFFEFKLYFKFWHLLKCLIQNLTRCNNFKMWRIVEVPFQNQAFLRSTKKQTRRFHVVTKFKREFLSGFFFIVWQVLVFLKFKIWHAVKALLQILTLFTFSRENSGFLGILVFLIWRSFISKSEINCKKCPFLGATWFFQPFFKFWHVLNFSSSDTLINFKIWIVRFPLQSQGSTNEANNIVFTE